MAGKARIGRFASLARGTRGTLNRTGGEIVKETSKGL